MSPNSLKIFFIVLFDGLRAFPRLVRQRYQRNANILQHRIVKRMQTAMMILFTFEFLSDTLELDPYQPDVSSASSGRPGSFGGGGGGGGFGTLGKSPPEVSAPMPDVPDVPAVPDPSDPGSTAVGTGIIYGGGGGARTKEGGGVRSDRGMAGGNGG